MDTAWIEALSAVAEHRSFTAAAKQLRISKQSISRRVAQLEEHLGAALIARSPRAVELTSQGRSFLERASGALPCLEAAKDELFRSNGTLSDHLRIGAPALFGRRFLNPILVGFLERHPGLQVSVEALGEADVSALNRLDILIHVGDPPDVAAKRIALGRAVYLVVASADHDLARIRRPEDLADHPCVVYSRKGRRSVRWSLEHDGRSAEVEVRPRYQSNDVDCAVGAIEAGLGVGHLPGFVAAEGIQAGRFAPVLPQWRVVVGPIWALYRPSRSPRRAFDIFIEAHRTCAREPGRMPGEPVEWGA